jgi:hypothetical protein
MAFRGRVPGVGSETRSPPDIPESRLTPTLRNILWVAVRLRSVPGEQERSSRGASRLTVFGERLYSFGERPA